MGAYPRPFGSPGGDQPTKWTRMRSITSIYSSHSTWLSPIFYYNITSSLLPFHSSIDIHNTKSLEVIFFNMFVCPLQDIHVLESHYCQSPLSNHRVQNGIVNLPPSRCARIHTIFSRMNKTFLWFFLEFWA